jgi:hypothetical protein
MNVTERGFVRRFGWRIVMRFSVKNRRRKAGDVVAFLKARGADSVLLVGVGGTGEGQDINIQVVERSVVENARRVVCCDLWRSRPPWPYLCTDGRSMGVRGGAFDCVLSNAVIEHVGDEADQRAFVSEHARVGRDWVITTPNRWFPVEPHTGTLFFHYSKEWRDRQTEHFSRLLSRREFARLVGTQATVKGSWWSPTFTAYSAGPR